MSHDARRSRSPSSRGAVVQVAIDGDAALVTLSGLIDETFAGFGDLSAVKAVVIDVSALTRMTSFGVRQWLKSMEALPKSLSDVYLLGCPTYFVDQLNMVLNFGGPAKVLTVVAPYVCSSCGAESGETLDVLAERANLMKEPPDRACSQCGGKLELDETPGSYFAFTAKYRATGIQPAAAALLASRGLYSGAGAVAEKPPRIIKLVHGSVTYFRISGVIGSLFRARPFLVGAEGEIVIDLVEVERFDPAGHKEWRRLIKSLASHVSAITLVDVGASFLSHAGDTLASARNVAVASLLAPYACVDCGRTSLESESLIGVAAPSLADIICATCGGTSRCSLPPAALLPLSKASTSPPPASVKVFERREEILSRTVTDANVVHTSGGSLPPETVVLGKYKIIRALSSGGMAEVFVAKQIGLGGFEKPVAIKRIQNKQLESRSQAIELFLNEAKIAGRLMHANIVEVLDVGQDGGALYLAMEYVHGKDLRDVCKWLQKENALMPLAEACFIAREIAQALHYAYWSTDLTGKQLSVVHRDVSPHNVILGYDGSVKLLDFGVATSSVTEHEQAFIVGKWRYMSPETTLTGRSDHRSDLFSLGVILYLLTTGTMPFSGNEPKEIVRRIRAGDYVPVGDIAPHVPYELSNLVARLLAPKPDDRPSKGEEVVAALNEIARDHDLESSAHKVAEYLSNMFPPDRLVATTDIGIELMRQYHEGSQAEATEPDRASSITPSARTDRRAIGISQTFSRVTPPGSVAARRSDVSLPPASPELPQARQRAATQNGLEGLMTILLVVVMLAAGAVVAYFALT